MHLSAETPAVIYKSPRDVAVVIDQMHARCDDDDWSYLVEEYGTRGYVIAAYDADGYRMGLL